MFHLKCCNLIYNVHNVTRRIEDNANTLSCFVTIIIIIITMPRGRSAISVLSDSSDLDFDGIAETEMEKLQRQFRITEGDRQAYSIQSQEIIRKQRQEISKLREEQDELLRTLHVLESQSRRSSETQETETIQTLLEQQNMQEDQLEKEKQTQTQLEQEIMNVEKKLVEARREDITTSQSHTSQTRHTQKAIRTLENKLDRALIRFNEQLTKNSQLREELETLRMERVRFQQLQRRLEKVLQDVRKDIGEVINMSTTAYEARVEAQTKMTMMKEKEMKDLAQYSSDVKELERVIAHEHRLKEFMSTKSNERNALDEAQEISRRNEMKEQRKADAGEEKCETLEEVFHRIQTVTGEENLEKLVTKFIEVEDRNFALFNYVNEQNTEADRLREEIHQIKEEMEQLRMKGLQQEEENQLALKQVKDLQQECEIQAQQYEAQAEDISKTLDQIKTGIDSVFSKMDCDRALMDDMLGSSSGIRDSNIMTYLSLVEQRTSELLTIQAFIKSKDLEKNYDLKEVAQFLLGQKADVQKQALMVQPHITRHDYEAEDSSLTDEEDRPLTHHELHRHIMMSSVLHKDESLRVGGGKDVKTPKTSTFSSSRQRSLED
ncbi:coiled-coil domain-containing protein 114 isoform X2 [Danio rerio]|uniref:Coiled-coil domain-containing protein 114 isoform X2 n=1 Tax=Danio rerio TaxID=7955 RepID=A0AC58GQC5_DANRE